ncbi:MAG: hypothetical protein JXA18_02065, partial [Chitinispirillaceae bacterium]|nr:hypothetical protein [Chitinispirillaceae bacterium]
IHDVPRGYYEITNWVVFTDRAAADIEHAFGAVTHPVTVRTDAGVARSRLAAKTAGKPGASESR